MRNLKKIKLNSLWICNLRSLSTTKSGGYEFPSAPHSQGPGAVCVAGQLNLATEPTSVTSSFMPLTNTWPDEDECLLLLSNAFPTPIRAGESFRLLAVNSLDPCFPCKARCGMLLLQRRRSRLRMFQESLQVHSWPHRGRNAARRRMQ